MVEHNMSVVSGISDTITVLQRGEILAEGDYASVSRNPAGDGSVHGDGACLSRSAASRQRRSRCCAHARVVKDLHAWYGESHVLHGVDFVVQPRRGRDAARPQRRGQDHHAQVHHGHGRRGARARSRSKGTETIALSSEPDRAARHRVLPRGARHLREPERAGEPAAAAAGARGRLRRSSRSTSSSRT